jgi:uncharacterized protein (DUF2147 family)
MKKQIRVLNLAALGAISALMLGAPSANANELGGTWLRKDNGASRVRFAKCGDAVCGTIVWLKSSDGPAKVGQRVFFDLKPNGANRWAGKAFNPEDGKTYAGKVSLNGDQLITEGCALGGLVCRSVNWARGD